MSLIQEVFLETDWDEVPQARAARDQRAAQLQAQGFVCACSTLQRATDGCQIFLVEAQSPEDLETEGKSGGKSAHRSKPKPKGARRDVEYR